MCPLMWGAAGSVKSVRVGPASHSLEGPRKQEMGKVSSGFLDPWV